MPTRYDRDTRAKAIRLVRDHGGDLTRSGHPGLGRCGWVSPPAALAVVGEELGGARACLRLGLSAICLNCLAGILPPSRMDLRLSWCQGVAASFEILKTLA